MADKKSNSVKLTASYEKDSKRYRRYRVDDNEAGILGTLYVAKDKTAPEKVTIAIEGEE